MITRALILAAGRGSRLGRHTENRPKCLVELVGRPLIDYQIAAMRGAGIEKIAVVRGYRRDMLAGIADAVFDNPRWADTGIVASLLAATAWLQAGPCIVSYSDIVYGTASLIDLLNSRAEIAVAYDPDWLALWQARFANPLSDAETFRLAPDGTLAEIGRRAASLSEIQGQYIGLITLAPAGFAHIKSLVRELGASAGSLDMTSILNALIGRGVRISVISTRGPWIEIDSESDLALAERWAHDGRLVFENGRS